MEIKTKTKCLEFKQLLEDYKNGKLIDKEEFEEAKGFLISLTGITFSDDELKQQKISDKIIDCLNAIQTKLSALRENINE